MLKYIVSFTILLFFYSPCAAQTSNQKDSLQVIIKKNQKDTNSIWAIYDYGRIMADEQTDSAAFYYEKGLKLSKRLNHKKGISGYYINKIFLVGYRKKDRVNGLKLAKEYLNFAINEKNELFKAKAYFSHAVVYQGFSQSDSAILFYEKSLKAFQNTNDQSEVSSILSNISNIYTDQKLYDLALSYALKSYENDSKNKDSLNLISDNVNLSNIYNFKKEYKKEEHHNREALRLSELVKSPYCTMIASVNMAEMFKDKKNYDSSLFYSKKAYQLVLKYGSDISKVEIVLGIAHAYSKKNDFKNANFYLNMAINDRAINDIELEKKLYLTELKINIFNHTGRYKEAAALLEEYNILTDSSFQISTQERVLEFSNRLKKAASEKVILEKEVKIGQQKTWLYVLSISALALLLTGFLFYRYQNKKQIAKSQQIKLLEQENEFVAVKAALEGQLNERVRISKEIHDDLGSSMTTISLLTEILKTKIDLPEVSKISDTSAKMVDAMNEIVWSLNTQNDSLESLVAFIRKYARDFLQDTHIKLVFDENVNQDFTLPGHVRRSIYLVIKEAINNVVKHADAHELKLNITTDNQVLVIKIQDDGKGMNVESKTVLGHGLKNMRQRMADIGGSLQITQSKGMLVELSFGIL